MFALRLKDNASCALFFALCFAADGPPTGEITSRSYFEISRIRMRRPPARHESSKFMAQKATSFMSDVYA